MKKSILALGILIAGLAAWVYVSPRLAAKHLQDAARSGDVAALDELVDFPLVREQLKADLKAGLLESSASGSTSRRGSPLSTSRTRHVAAARQREPLCHRAGRGTWRSDGRRPGQSVRLTEWDRRAGPVWFSGFDAPTDRAAARHADAIPRCKHICGNCS
jgi:Protein of unknown function (DUF2939)